MLTLTAKDIKRDASHVAKGIGVPAAAASLASLTSYEVTTRLSGVHRVVVSGALLAGGAYAAAKGKGKVLPWAGLGAAVGAVWGFLGGGR